MSNLYEVAGVHYGYRLAGQTAPVLQGVDCAIASGSFSCFVGPSGSGKTTLLNLLGLLDKPQRGAIRLMGEDVGALGERRLEALRLERIGFIFQGFYLNPTLSALENAVYFLGSLGWSRIDADARGREVLEMVGLRDHARRRPAQLSAGQCQRVAIARALAKRPRVIIADEPTANLDRRTAEEIVAVFKELQRKEGVSLVFATHDTHLVSVTERMYVLEDGKISERKS